MQILMVIYVLIIIIIIILLINETVIVLTCVPTQELVPVWSCCDNY